MGLKTVLIGGVLLVVFFAGALKVMDIVSPRGAGPGPVLVELPPLPVSAARKSSINTPINV
jgi:hypothetical protein